MHPNLRSWLGQLREAVAKQPPVGNAQLLEQLIASHEEADAEIARLTDRIEKEFAITDRAKARARELEATLAELEAEVNQLDTEANQLAEKLAATREESRKFGRDMAFHRCKNGEIKPYPCLLCSAGCSGMDFNVLAALRADDPGRVERVARAMCSNDPDECHSHRKMCASCFWHGLAEKAVHAADGNTARAGKEG